MILEEEEPGNQEEANSDEFVDDQEEAFSDGDSETEFDEVEEEVQNEAGALTKMKQMQLATELYWRQIFRLRIR